MCQSGPAAPNWFEDPTPSCLFPGTAGPSLGSTSGKRVTQPLPAATAGRPPLPRTLWPSHLGRNPVMRVGWGPWAQTISGCCPTPRADHSQRVDTMPHSTVDSDRPSSLQTLTSLQEFPSCLPPPTLCLCLSPCEICSHSCRCDRVVL